MNTIRNYSLRSTFETYISKLRVRINRIIRALTSTNGTFPFQAFIKKKKKNLINSKDLHRVELGKFMYLFYTKRNTKNVLFFLISKIHSYHTKQVSDFVFFYRECR